MQDITRKQIENLSDEDLKFLLETCTEISAHRKYQKLYNDRQEFCDLYEDTWVRLKHKFDEGDNFESQYMLVYIDKIENVYNSNYNSNCVTIVAKYIELYDVDVLDDSDIALRHTSAANVASDLEPTNTISFDTTEVIEFVNYEQVKKIVNNVIDKLKQNLL